MSETRTARCHCGALRLKCSGTPGKVSICHCAECKRRTGSAFSVAVFYPRDSVNVEGTIPVRFERSSASGAPVTFHFCRECGANVFWHPDRMPGLVGIAIGAFDNPESFRPEQSVWSDEMVDWLSLADGIILIDRPSSARAESVTP